MKINEDFFDDNNIETTTDVPDYDSQPVSDNPDDYQFGMTIFIETIPVYRTSQATGSVLTSLIEKIKYIFEQTRCCVYTEPYLTLCMNCAEPNFKPTKNYGGYIYIDNPTAAVPSKAPGITLYFNLRTKSAGTIARVLFAISHIAGKYFKTYKNKAARLTVYRRMTYNNQLGSEFSITPEYSLGTILHNVKQYIVSDNVAYEPLRLAECLHPLNGIPTLLREDFFDDNSVETDGTVEEETVPDNLFRFTLDMFMFKCPDETDIKPLKADTVTRLIKQAVSYIKSSPVFSGTIIEDVVIELKCMPGKNDREYFGMPYNEYVDKLPDNVFGIPVNTINEADRRDRLRESLLITFTASVEFIKPSDIYRFFTGMVIPKTSRMDTILKICPLFDMDEDKTKDITFWARDSRGVLYSRNGFVKNGYTQMYVDNSGHGKVRNDSFKVFYTMFMDYKFLVSFYNYIERTGKTASFPVKAIKRFIEEKNNENK